LKASGDPGRGGWEGIERAHRLTRPRQRRRRRKKKKREGEAEEEGVGWGCMSAETAQQSSAEGDACAGVKPRQRNLERSEEDEVEVG
jgi:hypothetical protein